MLIDIKRKFYQQPHDRPRWICPLYSRGGGHDALHICQSCDKTRKPWGSSDGKTYSHTDIICIAVSQYYVSFPRNWSTSAVNCMWTSQHWRWITVHELCINIEPQKRNNSHAFTNHGIWCCVYLLRQRKKMWCIWWDNLCFHNLSQFPSTVFDDEMAILCRFASECMTCPAQLRASMRQDWRCLQWAVNRRASRSQQ